MSDHDPLLRAVAHGHTGAPDGQALAALGKLVREASQPPRTVDLTARIIADIQGAHCRADTSDWIEKNEVTDEELQALLSLTRSAAELPNPVDVTGRVRLRLGVGRVLNVLDDRTGETRRRIRLFAAVVAGHLAAGLIFALVHIQLNQTANHNSDATFVLVANQDPHQTPALSAMPSTTPIPIQSPIPPSPRLSALPSALLPSALMPPRLPHAWTSLRDIDCDLFLLRRIPALRTEALHNAGLTASTPVITEALNWLLSQQDIHSGSFSTSRNTSTPRDTNTLKNNRDAHLATQSLALLSLLGESPDDTVRSTAIRQGLQCLINELEHDPATRPHPISLSLASLALIEGSLLFHDDYLGAIAERTLAELSIADVPLDHNGWSGFTLLAIETAQQGGLNVPGALLQHCRRVFITDAVTRNAATTMTSDASTTSAPSFLTPTLSTTENIGATTFAHYLLGMRSHPDTAALTARLITVSPQPADDGTLNFVPWFFTSLALRETGGQAWLIWNAKVSEIIMAHVVGDVGLRHVSAAFISDANGTLSSNQDIFATSLAILALQTPYRYMPVE